MKAEKIAECINSVESSGWVAYYGKLGDEFVDSYHQAGDYEIFEKETSGLCAGCGEKVKGKVLCMGTGDYVAAKFCSECAKEFEKVANEMIIF